MRALCWHGKGDVRVDTVPDPKIQHPRDAVIKMKLIQVGDIATSFVVTHPGSLEDAPEMHKTFRDKKDGVIKVVLRPGR